MVFGQLQRIVTPCSRVLHLGCGTSTWCEKIDDTFLDHEIIHADNSAAAVQSVSARLNSRGVAENKRSLVVCADALDMPFEADYFDLVIDKGTIDVFFASGEKNAAAKFVHEVGRVLKRDGAYVMISGEAPELRVPSFESAAATAPNSEMTLAWSSLRSLNVSESGDNQYEAFMYTTVLK